MSKGNISILGVGRLGLCMALCLEKVGYNVLGVDVSASYVDALNKKTYVSSEPQVSEYLRESKNFKASLSLDEGISFSDHLWVLVATPTGIGEKSYDHSMLSNLLCQINDRKVENKQVFIGCTVLPGYIANTARFLLRDCKNVQVCYNPEFIAQGDIIKGLENPDMVLIGESNSASGDYLQTVYTNLCRNKPSICRMSAESAEICKLAINCFITTKISFCNMISDIANNTTNSSAEDILNAVGQDSRIGAKCLKPGYGFGGPCFPRDNRALGNYARTVGVTPLVSVATDEYNQLHTTYMYQDFLKENKDEYVFDDVCYKSKCPVPIIEESQKLEVAKRLARLGKKVTIKDRAAVIKNVQLEFGNLFQYEIEDQ